MLIATVFGTIHHDLHRLRRSVLNPFFSQRSIASIQSVMRSKVRQMCDGVSVYGENGKTVYLRHTLTAATVDTVTEYCK